MLDIQKFMRPVFAVSFVSVLIAGSYAVWGQSGPDVAEPAEGSADIPYVLPWAGPFNAADIEVRDSQEIIDWFRSAHADSSAQSFRHWDGEEQIPPACATCHSGEGFRDFHGLDGTEAGVVNGPISPGGVVDCATCHSAGLANVTEVAFPSGLLHPVQGVEASCLTCHQGRTSGSQVVKAVDGLDLDTPNPALNFINPHYATAAATWLGGYGGAGYHYDGKTYSGRFFHARPVATCNSCHQPHTLEVAFESCLTCHQGDNPKAIRISRQSYDGSGDKSKGIHADILANAATLLDTVRTYAADVALAPLVYDGTRHPYFFSDANGDGLADQTADGPVVYKSWTPRSLRAAYNWKLVTADPGNYAHNPAYILELLYDSIEDLSAPLGRDIGAQGLAR